MSSGAVIHESRRGFLSTLVRLGVLAATAAGTQTGKAAAHDPGSSWPTAGKVQTVRGPIDAAQLGYTLPHEHICVTSPGTWESWPELFGGRESFADHVVTNLLIAKSEGIRTIIDVTPWDIGRNVRLLREISERSGVNIVTCTGHWLYPDQTMQARTTDELQEFFLLEISRGIDGTDIRPGVIKVATDHEGVTPFIERALRAAARASKISGIPVTTHTLAPDRTGEKQADIFESEGLDPRRVCLGHCDDSADLDYLRGLLRRGFTIGMDHLTWGDDEDRTPGSVPLSWQQRARTVKLLMDEGFTRQIFLSNDWYFGISIFPTGTMSEKNRRNPDGLLFSQRHVVPYLREIGTSAEQLHDLTVNNPMRFFGRLSELRS